MKRVNRIAAITILLSTILFTSFFVYHHSTAHACSSYKISGSNTHIDYAVSTPQGGDYTQITLSLWYNSCNSNNFAQAVISGYIDSYIAVQVYRSDGASSVAYQCPHQAGTCNGGYIYSPTLKAQACVNIVGTSVCTDFF